MSGALEGAVLSVSVQHPGPEYLHFTSYQEFEKVYTGSHKRHGRS